MDRKIQALAFALLAVPMMLFAQTDTLVADTAALSWGDRFRLRVDSVVQTAEADHYLDRKSVV